MADSNQKFLEENKMERQEIYLTASEKKKLAKHAGKHDLTGVKAISEKIIRDYIKANKLKA